MLRDLLVPKMRINYNKICICHIVFSQSNCTAVEEPLTFTHYYPNVNVIMETDFTHWTSLYSFEQVHCKLVCSSFSVFCIEGWYVPAQTKTRLNSKSDEFTTVYQRELS